MNSLELIAKGRDLFSAQSLKAGQLDENFFKRGSLFYATKQKCEMILYRMEVVHLPNEFGYDFSQHCFSEKAFQHSPAGKPWKDHIPAIIKDYTQHCLIDLIVHSIFDPLSEEAKAATAYLFSKCEDKRKGDKVMSGYEHFKRTIDKIRDRKIMSRKEKARRKTPEYKIIESLTIQNEQAKKLLQLAMNEFEKKSDEIKIVINRAMVELKKLEKVKSHSENEKQSLSDLRDIIERLQANLLNDAEAVKQCCFIQTFGCLQIRNSEAFFECVKKIDLRPIERVHLCQNTLRTIQTKIQQQQLLLKPNFEIISVK